jgi:hypothetical protein
LIDKQATAPKAVGEPPEVQMFKLPAAAEDRGALVMKLRNTPAAYQRRVGMAKAKPLGTKT